jgi:hypothetical protein
MRWKFPVYLQKKKELYINNLIELKFNPVYTINIIIIYRVASMMGRPKHDSVHINFCRLPQNSAIFFSMKQFAANFEIFWTLWISGLVIAFWSPLPKEGIQNFHLCLRACFWSLAFFNFGASRFF